MSVKKGAGFTRSGTAQNLRWLNVAYQTPSATRGFAPIYPAGLPAGAFKGRDGMTIPMRSKSKSSRDDRPPEGEPEWNSIRAAKVAARKLGAVKRKT
jgi:hypothetical protein